MSSCVPELPLASSAGRAPALPPHRVVLGGMVLAALAFYAYGLLHCGSVFRTVDGYLYYTHARSWYFDHDCDYTNDALLAPAAFKHRDYYLLDWRSPQGRVMDVLPCGWAVVALPFVPLADGLTLLHNALSVTPLPRDGYSSYYAVIVPLGHVLAGIIGLLISYALAARYFSRMIAALATVTAWAGTNVIYFVSGDPTMAHAASMAAVAGMFWMTDTLRLRGWSLRRATGLGLCCGMMVALRHHNIMWMIVPVMLLVPALVRPAAGVRPRRAKQMALVGWSVLVAGLCLAPQIIVNLSTQDAVVGWVTHWTPHWGEPRFDRELFALRTGLLTTYPLAGLALLGLIAGVWRRRVPRVLPAALAGFMMILYINACWIWAASPRRYVCVMVVFTLGLAVLLEWAARSRLRTAVMTVALLLLCARSVAMLFDPHVLFA